MLRSSGPCSPAVHLNGTTRATNAARCLRCTTRECVLERTEWAGPRNCWQYWLHLTRWDVLRVSRGCGRGLQRNHHLYNGHRRLPLSLLLLLLLLLLRRRHYFRRRYHLRTLSH